MTREQAARAANAALARSLGARGKQLPPKQQTPSVAASQTSSKKGKKKGKQAKKDESTDKPVEETKTEPEPVPEVIVDLHEKATDITPIQGFHRQSAKRYTERHDGINVNALVVQPFCEILFRVFYAKRYSNRRKEGEIMNAVATALQYQYNLCPKNPVLKLAQIVAAQSGYNMLASEDVAVRELKLVPSAVAGLVHVLRSKLGPPGIKCRDTEMRAERTLRKLLNDGGVTVSDTQLLMEWVLPMYFVDRTVATVSKAHDKSTWLTPGAFKTDLRAELETLGNPKC
jgi:hypothetical protein